MRKYSTDLLESMKKREYTIEENGLQVLVKPIPETDEAGLLDPRLYADMAPMLTGIKGFVTKIFMGFSSKKTPDIQKSAENMRNMMGGIKSIPIVHSVDVEEKIVETEEQNIPIRIYTPKEKSTELQPVFYFIHGGGFVAGSMDVVDELCKLVVEKNGCVAVQLDYRLAPEHPYPAGLDDCYAVLDWVYKNAKTFGGDNEKICISGDSAGGNLAAVCAMKDRDDGNNKVKLQALLYPTVDAANMAENINNTKDILEVSEKHSKVIYAMYNLFGGGLTQPSLGKYLGVKDDTDPYISPSLGDLKNLPPTIILLGEYDFLRLEDDIYAHKLKDAGVDVKLVRYRGLSHGFADQVGVTPQAEDALEEIANYMTNKFSK